MPTSAAVVALTARRSVRAVLWLYTLALYTLYAREHKRNMTNHFDKALASAQKVSRRDRRTIVDGRSGLQRLRCTVCAHRREHKLELLEAQLLR